MCGFVGFANFKEDVSKNKNILEKMNQTLIKRGPDEEGYYIDKHIGLAHKRLIVVDPEGGKQPRLEKFSFGTYVIVYNGQIYNTKELKKVLIDNDFSITTHSDTEILLKSYIHYGKDVVNHLNGVFAFVIWDTNTNELFLARDHFGIKPFYYTFIKDTFVFSSEIKGLLAYPGVQKIIDEQGISELFGIGPAHTPGTTVFKDIYEIKEESPLIWEYLIVPAYI